MSANTFFYFYSTAAQCLAAITGLAFVAIQMRTAFLDEKVTRAKRAVATIWNGTISVAGIESDMASHEATEILSIGKEKLLNASLDNPNHKLVDSLDKKITDAQQNRTESARLLLVLLVSMTISVIQLPVSEYFGQLDFCFQMVIVGINIVIFSVDFVFIYSLIKRVLAIQLIRKI